MESVSNSPCKKKRRISLSLSKGKKRFDVSSTNELECASVKFVPKNTTVAINWAFRIFDEWVRHSGEIEGRSYKSEDLWLLRDPEFYAKMMSQFCLEVKQQNGSSYTPKSLLQILINLQKYARSQDPDTFYFMNQKDARFKRVHTVLDNISRQLHKEGVGIDKIQARVVTDMEENHLWETGIIGTHSPTALQNAVFFYCGLYLCLRGGDEHRELKCSQLEIREVENPSDHFEKIKCLTYKEHGSKNRPGLIHHVHLDNKVVIHYASSSLGNRCFVYLMELYISKLPPKAVEKDLFYCKPAKSAVDGKPWYHETAVGHNTLKKKLKDMFLEAGLDSINISNHSLRATGVSRMYNKGIPEKLIMERSGHLSTAGVRSYERTTPEQKKDVSDLLAKVSSGGCGDRKPLAPANKLVDCTSIDKACENLDIRSKTLSNDKENMDTADQVSGILKHFNFEKMDGCTVNFNFTSK